MDDWQIVWTEPAVAALEQIIETVASDSPAGAESLRVELLESVEILTVWHSARREPRLPG
jgi:hypothetical protein